MAVAFYLLKVGRDFDVSLDKIRDLKNVQYAEGVGDCNVVVRVDGTYPKDMKDFWREVNEIGGITIKNKMLSPRLSEKPET